MMFLAMIAKKNGRVLKGGIPDKVMAARTVLRDWNSGKIPYFTRPPTDHPSNNPQNNNHQIGNVQVVSEFADAFDVTKMDTLVLDSLDNSDAMDFVEMKPHNPMTNTQDAAAHAAVQFLTGTDTTQGDAHMEEDD